MARDYGTRRTTRQKSSVPHQFLVITVTFLLGYLTASVFDFESVRHWLNAQVLAQQELRPEAAKSAPQHAELPPKPKFEFYTLLANEKGAPTAQPNATANHAAPTATAPATSTQASAAAALAAAKINSRPSNAKVNQPTAVKVTEGKPLAPTKAINGSYLVQVASFKARPDAEHMKGLLTLKGFDVNVVPVATAQGNWFRVVVGPYPNRILAQKAQGTLARTERLKGVLTFVKG